MAPILPLLFALAQAGSTNLYLEEARAAHDAMQYERAEARLRLAKEVQGSSIAERREIYLLQARVLAALGRMEEVEASFAELLLLDPHSAAPQRVPPRIRAAFDRAKERLYPGGFVRLEELPSPPGLLAARLTDPWGRVGQVLLHESLGGEGFAPRGLSWTDRLIQAELSVPPAHQVMAYYLEARSAQGELVASMGSAEQPRTLHRQGRGLALGQEPLGRAAGRGWRGTTGWAAGAVAIAAAAAATGLAFSASSDSRRAGHPETFGSETRRLDAQARQKALWANGLGATALVAGSSGGLLLLWD